MALGSESSSGLTLESQTEPSAGDSPFLTHTPKCYHSRAHCAQSRNRSEGMMLKRIHHVAIICSDYERSKHFYVDTLGLMVVREIHRRERDSWKLDLMVGGEYQIELFSFPNPPKRSSHPEACGLRHLAFEVENVEAAVENLRRRGVEVEPIRLDEITGRKFTFFLDPDGLPIEIYEA